ncbi:MAG TPA: substrate-binding domain-containing protein, partial [Beutenbergiaceae bacterium]|nr:substrate-binding domain-containing protein [Beutenbergiaceae bacterium]
NDVDALTALFACHLAGVKVPERMAVIGADNENFGQWSYPRLTTVAYKFHIENSDRESFNEHIQKSGTMGFMGNPSDVVRPHLIERDSA